MDWIELAEVLRFFAWGIACWVCGYNAGNSHRAEKRGEE